MNGFKKFPGLRVHATEYKFKKLNLLYYFTFEMYCAHCANIISQLECCKLLTDFLSIPSRDIDLGQPKVTVLNALALVVGIRLLNIDQIILPESLCICASCEQLLQDLFLAHERFTNENSFIVKKYGWNGSDGGNLVPVYVDTSTQTDFTENVQIHEPDDGTGQTADNFVKSEHDSRNPFIKIEPSMRRLADLKLKKVTESTRRSPKKPSHQVNRGKLELIKLITPTSKSIRTKIVVSTDTTATEDGRRPSSLSLRAQTNYHPKIKGPKSKHDRVGNQIEGVDVLPPGDSEPMKEATEDAQFFNRWYDSMSLPNAIGHPSPEIAIPLLEAEDDSNISEIEDKINPDIPIVPGVKKRPSFRFKATSNKHVCMDQGCSKIFRTPFHLRRHLLTHKNITDSSATNGLTSHQLEIQGMSAKGKSEDGLEDDDEDYSPDDDDNELEDEDYSDNVISEGQGQQIRKANVKGFHCKFPECVKKRFTSASGLTRHEIQIHGRPKPDPETQKERRRLREKSRKRKTERNHHCLVDGCGKSFTTPRDLRRHGVVHSSKGRKQVSIPNGGLKCDAPNCGKIFTKNREYLRHRNTHLPLELKHVFPKMPIKLKKYKCDEPGCILAFRVPSHLRDHKLTHLILDERPRSYPCPICNKLFTTLNNRNSHKATHGEAAQSRNCLCTECGKTLRNMSRLRDHMQIHRNERSHKCKECGKGFNSRGNLQTHVKVHTEERPVICEVCGKSFKTERDLTRHGTMHLPPELKPAKPIKERKHKCDQPGCTFAFTTHGLLQFHKNTHLPTELKSRAYPCAICNKMFVTPGSRNKHKKLTHAEGSNYLCAECGKSFRANAHLQNHMMIHKNERRYKCLECGEGFNHRTTFVHHARVHTGERPHICEICGKGFKSLFNLTLHMVKHTNERKYKCPDPTCTDGFKLKHHLGKHLRAIHNLESDRVSRYLKEPESEKLFN